MFSMKISIIPDDFVRKDMLSSSFSFLFLNLLSSLIRKLQKLYVTSKGKKRKRERERTREKEEKKCSQVLVIGVVEGVHSFQKKYPHSVQVDFGWLLLFFNNIPVFQHNWKMLSMCFSTHSKFCFSSEQIDPSRQTDNRIS